MQLKFNQDQWKERIQNAKSPEELDSIRVELLGKKGLVTEAMQSLKDIANIDEKKAAGQAINTFKETVSELLTHQKHHLQEEALQHKLQSESVDITLPGSPFRIGHMHPLSRVQKEIVDYFQTLGFTVADGPEMETPENNFDALNVAKNHPARAMQDTFYIQEDLLLRTHTSNVQIHTLREKKLPLRVLSPGRVYRSDALDATHSPMFFQVEGIVIDHHIHMGHLKTLLTDFFRHFFNIQDLPVRFRPSYFPFTEPSCEVDIGIVKKDGRVHIAAGEDWLEIMGCGMVHPNVLQDAGIDPKIYQGFAFGVGIDRLTMMKYGIGDIRDLYHNRQAWLSHFAGACS